MLQQVCINLSSLRFLLYILFRLVKRTLLRFLNPILNSQHYSFRSSFWRYLWYWLLLFLLTGCFSSIDFFLTPAFTLPCAIARFTVTGIYPFCTFNSAHCTVICETFILTFLGFSFYREYYVLRRQCLPKGIFHIALLSHILMYLWIRWRQDHPNQDPPLCLLW